MDQIFPPSKMLKARDITPGSLPVNEWQTRVRVVLVEPKESLNIGSVARAIGNLGFSRLHLVRPKNFDLLQAGKTACWARPILLDMPIHDSLEEALTGAQEVVAFSGRPCAARHGQMTLPAWAEQYHRQGRAEVAMMFGSEDYGLSKEHLEQARYIVRIPSFHRNPIFNLAQSVLLGGYELCRSEFENLAQDQHSQEISWEQYPVLDEIVSDVCRDTGYYREGTPHPTPAVVKNLLRRTRPNEQEISILIGLFSKIRRVLKLRSEQIEQACVEPQTVAKS